MDYSNHRDQILSLVETWVKENRLPWGIKDNDDKVQSLLVLVNSAIELDQKWRDSAEDGPPMGG